MKKTQLFSPIYSIIFAIVIVSSITLFKTVVEDWKTSALLDNDLINFETTLNLISLFNSYSYEFNTSELINISINENVVFSINNVNYSFVNNYNIPDNEFENINTLTITKNNDNWVIVNG